MGRANQKPRKGKGKQHQHLPKVDSAAELAHEGAAERSAVLDVMGLGNASKGTRTLVAAIGTIFLVCAIVALVVLMIF